MMKNVIPFKSTQGVSKKNYYNQELFSQFICVNIVSFSRNIYEPYIYEFNLDGTTKTEINNY